MEKLDIYDLLFAIYDFFFFSVNQCESVSKRTLIEKTKPILRKGKSYKAKAVSQKEKGIWNFKLLCSYALVLFLQNKANLPAAQIGVSSYMEGVYGNITTCRALKNKANFMVHG